MAEFLGATSMSASLIGRLGGIYRLCHSRALFELSRVTHFFPSSVSWFDLARHAGDFCNTICQTQTLALIIRSPAGRSQTPVRKTPIAGMRDEPAHDLRAFLNRTESS